MRYKKCFKCGIEKKLDDFYKHNEMLDGHLNKCKACSKKDAIAHRKKNIDRVRAYDRARGSRQDYAYFKDYRKNNRKKIIAQKRVSYAISTGKLNKQPCEICGYVRAVAHHDDYDKPLDVRWLCQAHHKQWHAKNGQGKNGG